MNVVRKTDTALETELYKKGTDRNAFLHYSSYHLPGLERSSPYSQLTRAKCICTSEDTYMQISYARVLDTGDIRTIHYKHILTK